MKLLYQMEAPRSPCQSSFHSFLSDVFSSCSKAPVGRLCPTLILLPLTARSLRCVSVWLHVSDLCPRSGCCISLKSLWQQSAWRARFFPLTSYLTFSPTLYCKSAFILRVHLYLVSFGVNLFGLSTYPRPAAPPPPAHCLCHPCRLQQEAP